MVLVDSNKDKGGAICEELKLKYSPELIFFYYCDVAHLEDFKGAELTLFFAFRKHRFSNLDLFRLPGESSPHPRRNWDNLQPGQKFLLRKIFRAPIGCEYGEDYITCSTITQLEMASVWQHSKLQSCLLLSQFGNSTSAAVILTSDAGYTRYAILSRINKKLCNSDVQS